MSYNEDFMPCLAESRDEASAAKQMALDALYRIGSQYDISLPDMAVLCNLVGVSEKDFMNYSGVPA